MRHCYVLRVFTREGEGGNHLGVVTDTTGLRSETMQAIATTLGFSETVFIDWKDVGDPRVRIFTPGAELPFAGHPLVGAAWLLNAMGPGAAGLECGVGTVEVAVAGSNARVWVSDFGWHVEPVSGSERLARAVGAGSLRAVHRVRMPAPYLMVEPADRAAVASAHPDLEAIAAMPDVMGLYLFAGRERVRARFFAPSVGVAEDPATGSAAVALAVLRRWQGDPSGAFDVDQGEEIGHPSLIHCRWDEDRVEIGGTVERDEVRVIDE